MTMAEPIFSIPDSAFEAEAVEALHRSAGTAALTSMNEDAGGVTGRWRKGDGTPLGREFVVDVVPADILEYPASSGEFEGARVPGGIAFSAPLPRDAERLEIRMGGASLAEVPVPVAAAEAARLPDPVIRRVGAPGASYVVPVFAERFSDQPKFFGAISQLHGWILTQKPFDDPAVGSKLAFDAHFWSSSPVAGLFRTLDSGIIDGRLFYGDRQLARRLLAPWTGRADVSLILIDSRMRGGAGGQPGYSAWTSITASPGERWEAVCLHEIGHGLGLADEYVDRQRENEWPAKLEPNVSADPRPSHAPWSDLVTVGDDRTPTVTIGGPGGPPGAVGTFQGARYRRDLYRAADTCLMKQTDAAFCSACVSHIADRLRRMS